MVVDDPVRIDPPDPVIGAVRRSTRMPAASTATTRWIIELRRRSPRRRHHRTPVHPCPRTSRSRAVRGNPENLVIEAVGGVHESCRVHRQARGEIESGLVGPTGSFDLPCPGACGSYAARSASHEPTAWRNRSGPPHAAGAQRQHVNRAPPLRRNHLAAARERRVGVSVEGPAAG